MVLLADKTPLVKTAIVGVLVTLTFPNETVFSLNWPKGGAPGNRFVIESMSFVLVLPNKGVRLKTRLVGLLLL